jgi:hypothetical protein
MFNSSEAVVSLPCGHYLHRNCYDEYIATAYQCPVCKKSAINMELHWRKLEDEIASQPMPSRWRGTIVEVRCNDCAGKSRCSYHWLGCRCGLCDSFNTVEIQVIGRVGENGLTTTAAENGDRSNRTSATLSRRAPRYFPEDEEEPDSQGLGSVLTDGRLALSNTAYEMLSRMTRSLSPLRHYFEVDGEDGERLGTGGATEAELEALGFWSDEDDDDDEYDYEDDDEEEEEDEDEESDDESHGNLNLSLIGHR